MFKPALQLSLAFQLFSVAAMTQAMFQSFKLGC
jgi:hypothetical protein